MTAPDPWFDLRRHTAARIALGRVGNSLPTDAWLRFSAAHALAREAVDAVLDRNALVAALSAEAYVTLAVESAAADRVAYLRRPDLGRRLSARSTGLFPSVPAPTCDLVVLIGDGLSARAAQTHALPLLLALRPLLQAVSTSIGLVAVATQARVALGDEVGGLLQARAVLVLIGERPGLSSTDSLGAYLTWAPRVGRSDAERNCVSNIRPEGLGIAAAARKLAWLLAGARRMGATGVALKDDSRAEDLQTLNAGSDPRQLPP